MSFENIQRVNSDDIEERSVTTTQVLVAELYDGRIASIAFRPQAGLFKDISGWTDADTWDFERDERNSTGE